VIRVAQSNQNIDVEKAHDLAWRSDPLLLPELTDERVRDHGTSMWKTWQAIFIDDVDQWGSTELVGGELGEFALQGSLHEVLQSRIHLSGSDFCPPQKGIRQFQRRLHTAI